MDYRPEIILETERLLFRPHVPADLNGYCAMEMDANVRRYVGGYPRTREAAEQRFKGTLKPVTDRLAMWAAELKADGSYIGRCGIYPHFDANGSSISGEAALGLYIAHAYWGKGYATEAGRAFIKFGFEELKLERIVTMIDSRNDASVHLIKKIAFDLEFTEAGEPRSFFHFQLKNPNAV